jgi:hypothetical protein
MGKEGRLDKPEPEPEDPAPSADPVAPPIVEATDDVPAEPVDPGDVVRPDASPKGESADSPENAGTVPPGVDTRLLRLERAEVKLVTSPVNGVITDDNSESGADSESTMPFSAWFRPVTTPERPAVTWFTIGVKGSVGAAGVVVVGEVVVVGGVVVVVPVVPPPVGTWTGALLVITPPPVPPEAGAPLGAASLVAEPVSGAEKAGAVDAGAMAG